MPDPPVNLQNAGSSSTQVAITWQAPLFNGGAVIIDYIVSTDTGTVVQSGITTLGYFTTQVTKGSTYKYKVQARNAQGASQYSQIITILASGPPA